MNKFYNFVRVIFFVDCFSFVYNMFFDHNDNNNNSVQELSIEERKKIAEIRVNKITIKNKKNNKNNYNIKKYNSPLDKKYERILRDWNS